jgi:predicted RNA-binding Zn ribbon-like protein
VQVNFESYARFGVELVSSEPDELEPDDPLSSLDGLRALLAPWPWLRRRAETGDLAPLLRLRSELRAVFDDAAEGGSAAMVGRINHLLARHRPQPSISGHDDSDWHLHIADDRGSVATEFATGAVMGLAMALLDLGADRFGSCADPRCSGVFIDTSRNRSRRYCSDRCASRANVAAHRERQRSVTG